jgi:hypothetical protein
LLIRFNRAGTGDDHGFESADFGITDMYNRVIVLKVPADELVWLGYSDGFGDAGQYLEVSGIDGALVAGDSDCGAHRARHRVAFETQLFDDAQDSLNLALGRVGFHHD